jgi:anaerobic magnesium-protoporphyrin IX monomethyl ester cyclase
MKVLLVQPPIEDFYDTSIRTYPLGLLYLGRGLKDVAEVAMADLRTGRHPKRLPEHPFPELSEYYVRDDTGPFSLFSGYFRFGASPEQIRLRIVEEAPDVVAVSSLFAAYSAQAVEVARTAKEVNDRCVTVLGGVHPTVFTESVLAEPSVDYVIRGEGETPLRDLVRMLDVGSATQRSLISGLCYRDGGGLRISPVNVEVDIDGLPHRNLIDAARYRIGRKRYTFMVTSRGCPYRCAFCGRPPVPYRRRGLRSIAAEIDDCLDRGIEAIDFEDDMLNLDPAFFSEVLDLFAGKGMTLSAMNGIYSENLDERMLDRMYAAGFRRLNFSLVDVSASTIRSQQRFFSENLLRLLPYLEDSSFLTEVHFIIGLPGQGLSAVLDTLIFLMGQRVLPGPSVFYLAPGSPIFDNDVFGGSALEPFRMRSSALTVVDPEFPRARIATLMRLSRFIGFVKRLLDQGVHADTLEDLAREASLRDDGPAAEILRTLIADQKFVGYDGNTGRFVDLVQDRALVGAFFTAARGRAITGFRTKNRLAL